MNELLIIASKHLPEDKLLRGLRDSLDAYERSKTQDNKQYLGLYCMFFSMREATEGMKTEEVIKEISAQQQLLSVFKKGKS